MKYLDENGLLYFYQKIKTWLGGKVDKVDGKSLSTNDYTTEEKTKLAGLENYSLPTASAETLGGVKVGAGLSINQGVLSATGGGTADSVDWSNVQNQPVGSLENLQTTDKTSIVNAINEVYGGTSVVISDSEEDSVIKEKLLSCVNSSYEIIKPAFLINDGAMVFTLADVDTESGNKQFRFKAGNIVDMDGQNTLYSVEILYSLSSSGELSKNYATGMFLDSEATIETINSVVDGKGYQTADDVNSKGDELIQYVTNQNYQTADQVNAIVEEVVGAAPEALDTLKELADALGNDSDFAGTVTNELAKKVDASDIVAITNSEIDTICAS